MCWIFSATKNLSRSVSCVWADLFWFIISLLVDFIPSSRNEIETKTSSFKNAGVGPFLRGQVIRYLFLKNHLDLECMRKHDTSFSDTFWFPFLHWAPGFLFGKWSFRPSDSLSVSKWRERLVFVVLVISEALVQGLCSHWVSLSLFRCNVLERWGPNCYQSSSQERKQCELSVQLKGKHDFYLISNVSFLITN